MDEQNAQKIMFDYLTRTQVKELIRKGGKDGTNTTSIHYSYKDIHLVRHWHLTLKDVVESPFAFCLGKPVKPRPPATDQPSISNEKTAEGRLERIFWPHVRTALEASHPHLPEGFTKLFCDIGESARRHPAGIPDRAGRETDDIDTEWRINRLPGEVKVSWKWNSDMPTVNSRKTDREYRQVLSQLLFYMKDHMCRWGYIITNKELVCARRQILEDNIIEVADAIPLTYYHQPPYTWSLGPEVNGRYPEAQGELTALLAIWYLHMLASNDSLSDGWFIGWGPKRLENREQDDEGEEEDEWEDETEGEDEGEDTDAEEEAAQAKSLSTTTSTKDVEKQQDWADADAEPVGKSDPENPRLVITLRNVQAKPPKTAIASEDVEQQAQADAKPVGKSKPEKERLIVTLRRSKNSRKKPSNTTSAGKSKRNESSETATTRTSRPKATENSGVTTRSKAKENEKTVPAKHKPKVA
ncbi:hypothetical protein NEOLEDRAFT_1242067 [Neolentinus lepideus HHB14362 ss-1]|uniref:Uncharacterized protein n=1 Tax=Neolentinus lepideus HHB14362 ss-1 TaxID=1314782 RepID=A0A165SCT2_9AGAM|nr:hypothetical protein NEOLEDRAFT_1242067 [Neolentinus lepideus HHB14362 ss-1]